MSASILAGCRLVWLVNKASWSVVTAQVGQSKDLLDDELTGR